MEQFKDYYGFQVSNYGRILKNGKEKKLVKMPNKHYYDKQDPRPDAYYWGVRVNGKYKKVHQIVAECFLPPNPGKSLPPGKGVTCYEDTVGLYCIDHCDGNKHNNRADNLRWCEWYENTKKGNLSIEQWEEKKKGLELERQKRDQAVLLIQKAWRIYKNKKKEE